MYIKSIEISGFKSYKDTRVDFSPGFNIISASVFARLQTLRCRCDLPAAELLRAQTGADFSMRPGSWTSLHAVRRNRLRLCSHVPCSRSQWRRQVELLRWCVSQKETYLLEREGVVQGC
jgi:hypothetical protein